MTLFEKSEMSEEFADKIIAVNQKRLDDESVLKILQQEQDKIIKSKNNIIAAIEQGIYTSSTKERLEELEKQLENINEKILIEQAKAKTVLKKSDVLKFLKKALNNNIERIIDLLVK